MKKFALLLMVVFACTSIFAANPFSDVKASHWAYKAIESLAGKGVLEGYPDGTFKGAKTLTRYEAAMMIAKLMGNMGGMGLGAKDLATLERLIVEFSDELALIGVKVTALEDQVGSLKNDVATLKSAKCGTACGSKSGKIDITGDMKMTIGTREYENDSSAVFGATDVLGNVVATENDWENEYKIGLNLFANIDEDVTGFVRLRGVGMLGSNNATNDALWRASQIVSYDDSRALMSLQDLTLGVEYAYVDVKNIFDLGDLRLGRQNITLGHNLVFAAPADAMKFDKVMDQVSISALAFDSNNSMFDTFVNANLAGDARNVVGAQVHENGFDSKAIDLSVDFGGHAVGFYYFTQSYDVYDPYARMGDRYAVSYGINKTGAAVNGVAANDHYTSATAVATAAQGYSVPTADPAWWAITLDGNVMENLDYFFEYIDYDSDLSSANNTTAMAFGTTAGTSDNGSLVGTGAAVGTAVNVVLPGRELGGQAWLLGLDWDLTDDLNLILQYGVGDEEFAPSTIDFRQRLNGMMGRFNAQATRNSYYWAPTSSLQGVKDIFAKLSYDFNDKTSGYLSYENCKENDSSAYINVVTTDNLIYNTTLTAGDSIFHVKPTEYAAIGFGVKHQYRPNTAFTIDYLNMQYDQDDFDQDAIPTVASPAIKMNLAPNAGGWQTIKAAVEVKF